MATPENVQLAKEFMLAILSSPNVRPSAMFGVTVEKGQCFEEIWKTILAVIEKG
jgi:hypothetical protein